MNVAKALDAYQRNWTGVIANDLDAPCSAYPRKGSIALAPQRTPGARLRFSVDPVAGGRVQSVPGIICGTATRGLAAVSSFTFGCSIAVKTF
jgi:hypothetical protein